MENQARSRGVKRKLHGREFYQSLGSPRLILAPMVDQSEFAWRMLTRSFMSPPDNAPLLAYTPMFHARMFTETPKYRENHFQPLHGPLPSPPDPYHASQAQPEDLHLDGNPAIDRPLFVQFCANSPDDFLLAAQHVAPFCDAVDLNLGCPQGIARRGRYGAFLQEDWDTIYKLISSLHRDLSVPVTAKFRIQESKEKTLDYAKMILSAGASIITVHGRQRDQKGHNTGLADWSVIRYLRENLPPDTVIFANGNILQHDDIQECLEATGVDGVMSAEGNLYDPSIFAVPPPVGQEGREYWRGADGKGGWRMDAVFRRYMDIIHKYVLGHDPPARPRLYIPSDGDIPTTYGTPPDLPSANGTAAANSNTAPAEPPATEPHTTTAAPQPSPSAQAPDGPPPKKKQKRKDHQKAAAAASAPTPKQRPEKEANPNLVAMQAHLFHLLRALVSKHTHIRDALARCRAGDIAAFERVLGLVERAVAEGVREHAAAGAVDGSGQDGDTVAATGDDATGASKPVTEVSLLEAKQLDPHLSSLAAVERCRRPWFVCQPYVRPLPKEAIEKGAMQVSKKEKKRLELERLEAERAGLSAEGRVEGQVVGEGKHGADAQGRGEVDGEEAEKVEVPREGLVCG